MSNNTPSIRALQAIGITTTAFLSGGMTIISVMAIPALLSSPTIRPSTALRQWTSMYALGKVTTPPSLTFTSLLFFYLSYRHLSSYPWYKPKGRLFLAAGGIVAGVLAFTYGVLERTNHEMLRLAKGGKDQDGEFMVDREEKIRELLERWRVLNLARGVALGVATVVGTYGVFRRGKWIAKANAAGRSWRRDTR